MTGGKGAGLLALTERGYPVPPFFVIPPDADPDAFEEKWRALGAGRVAVRSSAIAEDGVKHSFAGQYVSFLGVEGWDAVRRAIADCRASGESERVRAYCDLHGLPLSPVAVVVQRMIEGEASGVMFTATPEDPERVLISAGVGLGEGVVQGAVACDTWRVGETVEGDVAKKDTAMRLVDGAVREVPVADPAAPAITEAQVRALADLGRRVERDFGRPMDVEWTVEGDRLWLLQARPVTTPIPRGRRLLWDNSNIIESYNGVTTPLTYSFASNAYTIVYQLFLRVMGVEEEVIRANSAIFPRMIGLIRGRVYYNLNAWYRLITLLPGYRFNKGFMEQMMGVREVAAEEDAGGSQATDWSQLPRLLRLGARMIWKLRGLDADIAGFRDHFDRVYDAHRGKDLAAMPPEQLVDTWEELERELLWAWSVPIVNDFFTMIAYGTLKKLCGAWVPDAGELHNELLSGEGGLESTAPMHEAIALADVLRAHGIAAEDAATDPRSKPTWDTWMAKYGDRCVNELKLETPSLRQDPSFLYETLRNYLRNPPQLGAPVDLRSKAEARAFAHVKGLRRVWFRLAMNQARARVRDRENLRFLRTRIFGLARDIFRALAGHMVAAGAIDVVDDVFYLTVPEVLGWVRGTTHSLAFRETIAVRRREFEGYQKGAVPAERFHTRGAVHAHNPFVGKPRPVTGELKGTGCCPGVVEGPVAVLADPHEGATLNGEILVAFRTDPGWVPLYPNVSGLLVERGSLLSHSAVVAREIGLPTIIGIPGLTQALKTGEKVRMDGSSGEVEKL
ncbi:MAG: PEP/pyruvate-binding domain-containing protein [Myxococcota bacterium]